MPFPSHVSIVATKTFVELLQLDPSCISEYVLERKLSVQKSDIFGSDH